MSLTRREHHSLEEVRRAAVSELAADESTCWYITTGLYSGQESDHVIEKLRWQVETASRGHFRTVNHNECQNSITSWSVRKVSCFALEWCLVARMLTYYASAQPHGRQ